MNLVGRSCSLLTILIVEAFTYSRAWEQHVFLGSQVQATALEAASGDAPDPADASGEKPEVLKISRTRERRGYNVDASSGSNRGAGSGGGYSDEWVESMTPPPKPAAAPAAPPAAAPAPVTTTGAPAGVVEGGIV